MTKYINTPEEDIIRGIYTSLLVSARKEGLPAWTTVPGRRIEFEYWGGVDVDNPSGATDNVKLVRYISESGELVVTNYYTYDASNKPLTIQSI